ncbi:hypothetical protein VPNG_07181 [Cytospora leucostoma]|uniref:Uncharacterized protein n=1 Tax=Cytospora leucostoma TaxID=1230097 RepID=A0A423WJI0_9PEZI|nr:hypothetical protein VPNG_07181 [Cytospora leucostoma]
MAGPQQAVIDLTLDDIISSQEIPNQQRTISSRKRHFEDLIDEDDHAQRRKPLMEMEGIYSNRKRAPSQPAP